MDPNAALRSLREQAKDVTRDSDYVDAADVATMVETFEGLDEWLAKGGFSPEAWQSTPSEGEVKALVAIEATERLVKRALRALAEDKDPAWARLLLTQAVDVTTARTCTAVKSLALSDEISIKADDIVAKEVKVARRVQASEQGREPIAPEGRG